MIDVLMIYMALTLSVAGCLLFRDHVRFLRGTYFISGSVISVQPVFISRLSGDDFSAVESGFVKNGFYPVIEYSTRGGNICFTAIDPAADGRFHVGDQVKLRISKTRRKENRACKTAMMLVAMLCALLGALLYDLATSMVELEMENIFLASGVIAIGLAILVSYVRDRDENDRHEVTRTQGGKTQLCLFEPTAFKNWSTTSRDRVQINKIRSKQFFGATCFCSAMLMVAMAV